MDDDTKYSRRVAIGCIVLLGCSLMPAGCTLPRVCRLSDTLTAEEHLTLGVAYEQEQRYDDATRQYQKALDAGLSRARIYLGNAASRSGNYIAAEEHYLRALEHFPRNAALCNNLAWLYYKEGVHLRKAEALAEKAVELEPNSSNFHHTLTSIQAVGRTRQTDRNPEISNE